MGIIARWYLTGVVDGDDEVAVLFDPQTQRALTVPMVDVRYVLRLALRRRIIARGEAGAVYRRSRAVYYMERTWDDVCDAVPQPARSAFRSLAERYGNLKRRDAVFALRSVLRRMTTTSAR